MATAGYPGTFPAGLTVGYRSIGAVQKQVTSAGFPGTFPAALTVGYLNIGAVQKTSGLALTLSVSDSVTVSDSGVKEPRISKAETVTASDAILALVGKILSDSVSFSDSLSNQPQPAKTETITLSDDGSRLPGKASTDSVALTDSLANQPSKPLSDSVSLSDSAQAVLVIILTISDSFSVSDSLSKEIRKLLADSTALTDATSTGQSKVIQDALVVADVLAKLAGKPLAESALSLTDAQTTLLFQSTEVLVELLGKKKPTQSNFSPNQYQSSFASGRHSSTAFKE